MGENLIPLRQICLPTIPIMQKISAFQEMRRPVLRIHSCRSVSKTVLGRIIFCTLFIFGYYLFFYIHSIIKGNVDVYLLFWRIIRESLIALATFSPMKVFPNEAEF